MGKQYIVTQILTQGRQGSDEYVREYFLEFSDDSKTWRRYTNQLGVSEVGVYFPASAKGFLLIL